MPPLAVAGIRKQGAVEDPAVCEAGLHAEMAVRPFDGVRQDLDFRFGILDQVAQQLLVIDQCKGDKMLKPAQNKKPS
ncbi:MAG: hypothetical protein WBM81_04145 [Sedimenticolaceae bacterium]